MKDLSNNTVNELFRLGYESVPNSFYKPGCCFKVFFNWSKHITLTIVYAPMISNDWLVSVFDRLEDHSYDLSNIEGFVIDEKQRVHFKSDEDIIPFVEVLNSKVIRNI